MVMYKKTVLVMSHHSDIVCVDSQHKYISNIRLADPETQFGALWHTCINQSGCRKHVGIVNAEYFVTKVEKL